MAKIALITGADGFIGSHLTEQLVRRNYDVVAFSCYNSWTTQGNLEHCSADIRANVKVVAGDIRDFHSVRNAMRGCDLVFHLAALIGIPYSYVAPQSYVDTNVSGTLNILQAARDLQLERIVHTSTSEVYGTARFVPINEEHPLQPQSPYSATKIAADSLALSYYHSFETPVVVVRPFNTYGPRQSPRAVIPAIINQILGGARTIKLGSLHPTRDFNYVLDTCSGFIAAAETETVLGEVVNIGSNFEISVADVVQLISKVMQTEVEVVEDALRLRPMKSEVERLWCDNTKAKKLLNWQPLYAGIEGLLSGLQETINWYQQNSRTDLPKLLSYHI